MEFLEQVYWNNTVLDYAVFLLALTLSLTVIFFLGRMLLRRIAVYCEKTQSPYGELIRVSIKRYLLPIAYFAAFYSCTRLLALNDTLVRLVRCGSTLFAIVMGAMFLSSLIAFSFGKLQSGKDENGALAIKWLIRLAKAVVWGLALILFLDNVGVKITSLVTGLGIGGVAIAFAAQSALSDIFCFFTIFFDKPYEIGDFIIAGEHMGTVEHIGVKTTRLRALGGEQLIASNADLTGSRIRNYKTLQQRRVSFTLGVPYDTPSEQLRKIPDLIREVVEATEETSFSRAHFASFGTYCLNIEVVYFVLGSDFDRYMDINQRVNIGIKEEFERLGVPFAIPTTTVRIGPAGTETAQK
ncbi:MAG: mechanosensitive ion channel family protein [Eubacteriales bacterium]|nr:mechanosensitive ion channel family protein [Eubacteriales bacterium]